MSNAVPLPHDLRAVRAVSTEPSESSLNSDEFFSHQPSPRSALPGPTPLLENLTRCVIEILAGARDLEQISRWVTDDVYRHLLKRPCASGVLYRVDLAVRAARWGC